MPARNPEVPDAVVQHVVDTVAAAAGMAAASMVREGAGTGFATLEDKTTGEATGIVLVCLDPRNTAALLAFARSLPGAREGRIS